MAMATTTTSNSMAEPVERDWHSLSPDIQERILLQLPISAAVKLASVCKQWLAIFGSPSFASQLSRTPTGKQPWFFVWGINELIHTRSVAFAFDPQVGRWFRLQTARPPDFNRASLSGTSGLFFAFSGSKVCFNPTPTKMKWKETSPAISTRCSALMGTFGSPLSSSFTFVTVGGVLDGGDDRMVEMYDACTNTWESCDPLPVDGFHDSISSHWMSSAVLGHKFYVADYYGDIAAFDIHTKSWSKVESLRVPDLVSLFIIAADEGLYAIGVCRGQIVECCKLFKVDEHTTSCKEVSEMPHDLFSQFADEQKEASLRCVGSGNLIYVCSELNYKGYPVCMCDLSESSYEWKQLPSLPSPPRFDRVVYCSTTVTPRACLEVM